MTTNLSSGAPTKHGLEGRVGPAPEKPTVLRFEPRRALALHLLGLELYVSLDEEYVCCTLLQDETRVELASRSHNVLLLLLARARLEDASRELPEPEQGWRYRDELATMLKIDGHLLNVWIHRASLQFQRVGMVDTARLIERRTSVRQVRLGPSHVVIRQP